MTDQQTDDAPLASSRRADAPAELRDALADGSGTAMAGRSVTIGRPADEVYAFFRDFSNLSAVMENVVRVDVLDERRSHWVVRAPAGRTVEWDSTVTRDEPGRLIEWKADAGADVPNSGRVAFDAVEGRGTVVTLTTLYDPPGGTLGKVVAKLFQREPAIQARRDLNRLKQYLETGEVATAAVNTGQHEEEDA